MLMIILITLVVGIVASIYASDGDGFKWFMITLFIGLSIFVWYLKSVTQQVSG